MEQKAFFITFEGGEGSGKTNQTDLFSQYLESENLKYYKGREPGGTQFSEAVRALSKNIKYKDSSPKSKLFLIEAARADILDKEILPALMENKIVVLDRFIDSTIAYQSFGLGIDLDEVFRANQIAIGSVLPDLTIYLNIDPRKGFERKKSGADKTDIYESFDMEFYDRVQDGYEYLAKNFPNRVVKIDSTQSIKQVFDQVVKIFNERYSKI